MTFLDQRHRHRGSTSGACGEPTHRESRQPVAYPVAHGRLKQHPDILAGVLQGQLRAQVKGFARFRRFVLVASYSNAPGAELP